MEPKKPEINFVPLSSGLGFHPFSDGLPYAPVVKTAQNRPQPAPTPSTGTGAVAAGLPTLPRQAPRINVPVARAPKPMTTPAARPSATVASAAKPKAKSEAPISKLAAAEPKYGFLYVVKRVLAYWVDSAINLGLCGGALGAVLWNQNFDSNQLLNSGVIVVVGLFLLAFNWILITAQEIAFNTTAGKRLFGLAITGSTGALFLRACLFPISVGLCGLGLVWALVDPKKCCWHDRAVGVQPIEIARL